MGDVSKHFNKSEFTCKCGCGFVIINPELITVLEGIRQRYGIVRINSACRCAEHNKAVGGSSDSQHMRGTASDIIVEGFSPFKVQQYLIAKYADKYGIGSYTSFTHIDVRATKARWKG